MYSVSPQTNTQQQYHQQQQNHTPSSQMGKSISPPFHFQAYRLAELARHKLVQEASRADHDLRPLVAHANLLDTLLLSLQPGPQSPSSSQHSSSTPQKPTNNDNNTTTPALIAQQHAMLHNLPSTAPLIMMHSLPPNADTQDSQTTQADTQDYEHEAGEIPPPLIAHGSDESSSESSDSSSEDDDEYDEDEDEDVETERYRSVTPATKTSLRDRPRPVSRRRMGMGMGLRHAVVAWASG